MKKCAEQSMVAHGGESPTHKANARRHVAHATVSGHCKCTSIKRPTKKLTLRWSC